MKGYLLAEGKRLVLAVLAFLVVFAAVPGLRLVHLLGLLAAGLCALGLLYRNASSRFFGRVMVGGTGCLGGFVLARTMLQDRPLRMVSASEYALLFLDFLLWAGLLLWSCRADAAPKREKPPLFKEQVPDKARLIQYIQDLPIVGIHAKWGNGKSFLWENLRSDLQAQFEIVQIDLLACDLDEIEAFLIRELEKVLERGQIYPENAHYLKAQLGKNSALEKLGGIAGESGFSDTFDSLQQELERLPKKVLLNFEDIDRIRSEEVIQKIFAISEKLASDRVHVVFQYNKEALPGRLPGEGVSGKVCALQCGPDADLLRLAGGVFLGSVRDGYPAAEKRRAEPHRRDPPLLRNAELCGGAGCEGIL